MKCLMLIGGLALAGTIALAPQHLRAQEAQDSRVVTEAIVKDYLAAHPDELGEIVKAYFIKHPEAVGQILAELLKHRPGASASANTTGPTNRRAAIATNAADLFSSPHQVTLGDPQGDVTLVEFFDYNCGFCKRALADTLALIKDDPHLKIVLKEFPILGPGSAEAARAHPAVSETIALGARRGKALNDSELLARARGRYALLLNEDSELLPGATLTLWQALQENPAAACAGARLLRPDGTEQASAWRFPSPLTALAGALLLHRRLIVQSSGQGTREVDWCQSAALLVRRDAAAQVGYLDADFFVYSDEVDFALRLRRAGWRSVYVPEAAAVHHEQLSSDAVPERRIVELARNRDLYMRKHHSTTAARAVRWLTAWAYALRAIAALALPGRDPRRYLLHARATLRPHHGEGLREAAERLNASLAAADATP